MNRIQTFQEIRVPTAIKCILAALYTHTSYYVINGHITWMNQFKLTIQNDARLSSEQSELTPYWQNLLKYFYYQQIYLRYLLLHHYHKYGQRYCHFLKLQLLRIFYSYCFKLSQLSTQWNRDYAAEIIKNKYRYPSNFYRLFLHLLMTSRQALNIHQ